MPLPEIARPDAGEYAPCFGRYIEQVPEGHILAVLEAQLTEREPLAAALEARGDLRYAPDKWSVKQVLGHVTDTERVFQLRAVWAARSDPSPLPGFEQDPWVAAADFDRRSVPDLLEEFVGVRTETVRLFRRLVGEVLVRTGMAAGKPFSVRAIPYLLAGHELHHRRVLRERYLAG